MDPVAYNNLPLIATATQNFEEQVDDHRDALFSDLSKLFGIPGNENLRVCLVHRHYRLRTGERIVSISNSTNPSKDQSLNIVADHWLSDDTLGVCYDPTFGPAPFSQAAGTGSREQFISAGVPASDSDEDLVYESSWDPKPTPPTVTMACDQTFSIRNYNTIRTIAQADQVFDEQLDRSPGGPITRDEFFSDGDLVKLFQGTPYAVFLVHRHYALKNGERMVTTGNTSQPSTDLNNMAPERWFSTGEHFEHRSTNDGSNLPSPPSDDFLNHFREIISEKGIDGLGVALAPDVPSLQPGHVFLEQPGKGDRQQVVTQVPDSLVESPDIFQSSWVPLDGSATLSCKHNCQNCYDTTPPLPLVLPLTRSAAVIEEIALKSEVVFVVKYFSGGYLINNRCLHDLVEAEDLPEILVFGVERPGLLDITVVPNVMYSKYPVLSVLRLGFHRMLEHQTG
ncbi:hypothetical protein GALMADRAFT_213380 [Galerina marginata CBS 339.88]|uniref:Uncharacterized protein n=1 Tax=Galerina marginata (strain CBS 339.88) TaxID=685588 RepID=A0A067SQT7_GALM3|nr:hypothetical protein GALMADRAFT_213380 [Galerina marginata CBS 339.88]